MYDRLYAIAPPFVQSLLVTLYAVKIHLERYGAAFRRQLEELEKTEWFSPAQLAGYQNGKLRALIHHAYATVPYYRRVMDKRNLVPDDIRTNEDIRQLPVLTKSDVKRYEKELLSKAYRKNQLIPGHTSGTTGSPLEVYWDKRVCIFNNASFWRQARWAGLEFGDRFAVALARVVTPASQKGPPFWRMNYLHNHLWISLFHLSEQNLHHYLRKLEEFRPAALECYTSAAYIIAKYLESRGKTLPMKAVITSSEPLYPFQRETIEKAFECRIFDYYGMAERVVFATECARHRGPHLNMEYGICEILDSENTPVEDGREGFIVGTSLHNYAMPLIRYKTSDISAIKKETCSCGRGLPLMNAITTRTEDIIVTPEGNFISPPALTHPFKPMKNIKMSQIIQDRIDHILIKVVPEPEYSSRDTQTLLVAFRERVGPNMQIDVVEVPEIPRTSSGKFRWIISEVPMNFEHEKAGARQTFAHPRMKQQ